MGYKSVCLDCRKVFSQGTDFTKFKKDKVCPNCGKMMIFLNEKFRPPKINNGKEWEVVKFLIKNGYHYDHIWEYVEQGTFRMVNSPYPKTMKEAEEFIKKYKNNDKYTHHF